MAQSQTGNDDDGEKTRTNFRGEETTELGASLEELLEKTDN